MTKDARWTLTQTGGEGRVGLGDVDAVVEDVRGGGGGLAGEHDRLVESCWIRRCYVRRLIGVTWRTWMLSRRMGRKFGDWMRTSLRLLLLDAWRRRGPSACPHTGVAGVGLVLGPRPLQVLLQVSVNVSLI